MIGKERGSITESLNINKDMMAADVTSGFSSEITSGLSSLTRFREAIRALLDDFSEVFSDAVNAR